MTKFDPQKHRRRSIRLPGYDYSQAGAYFVTLVTWQRESLFGEVVNGEMILNDVGKIVQEEWLRSEQIRDELRLDVYVVMPNHFHGIVILNGDVGATGRSPLHDDVPRGPAPKSLGALIAGFKSSVSKRINILRETSGIPVWQRNYYEHVIRNEHEFRKIWNYIEANPANWQDDSENPINLNP
jgi:REP element-mobilizing transposase RayT